MDKLTFIVITYNHSKYVIECLESIKNLVVSYARKIEVNLLVSDDNSNDGTLKVVNDWITINSGVFCNCNVITRDKNVGTVRNIYESIKKTKTEDFVFIAGDDKYLDRDFFSFYEKLPDGMTICQVETFGGIKNKENMFIYNYYLSKYLNKSNSIAKWLRYQNFLVAPGVFLKAKYYKDSNLWKKLLKYKLIEDFPTWIYFLEEKNLNVFFDDNAYKCYRVGSGVSTKINKNSVYYIENKKMKKDYNCKVGLFPNFINPFYYKWLVLRVITFMSILFVRLDRK